MTPLCDGECKIGNGKCRVTNGHAFFFALLTMDVNMANNSPQSAAVESYSDFVMLSVRKRISIQYAVSPHSFNAMDIFDTKSALLCADSASRMLAPIDVPDRSTCRAIASSLRQRTRHLYRFTIRTANDMLFSPTTLCFMMQLSTLHSQFSTSLRRRAGKRESGKEVHHSNRTLRENKTLLG